MGEVFRARLRQFPALVNCCTIDWFSEWPPDALQSVAMRCLSDLPELDVTDAVLDGLVRDHLLLFSPLGKLADRAVYFACVSFLIFFYFRTIFSESTGWIFTIFSPNDRYLCDCEQSGPLFMIPQGTLPWQPILLQNFCICVHSAEQRLKMACNIAILIPIYLI